MRKLTSALSFVFVALLWSGMAWAGSGVTIESKTVKPGAKGVTVGIYLENHLNFVGVVLPLEIRSLDKGAFLASRPVITVHNRLLPWEKGSSFKVLRYVPRHTTVTPADPCGRIASRDAKVNNDTTLDLTSPDAIMYTCVGIQPMVIEAGSDGKPGEGEPSLLLTFDVGQTLGRIEIDSTCLPPANNIVFVSESVPFQNSPIQLSYFHKGIVTISEK